MGKLKRFGVSLNSDLLAKFDKLIDGKGYGNRSEAIRDLIREELVSEEWKSGNKETVGVFSLVYDHHESDISQLINNIQQITSILSVLPPMFILITTIAWK